MVHLQRDALHFEVRNSRERYLGSVRRLDVNVSQRRRRRLELRRDLHDHVVLVQGLVGSGDLSLAESIVQSVVDVLWRDAEPACGVAIDDKIRFKPIQLLIAGHIRHDRDGLELIDKPLGP